MARQGGTRFFQSSVSEKISIHTMTILLLLIVSRPNADGRKRLLTKDLALIFFWALTLCIYISSSYPMNVAMPWRYKLNHNQIPEIKISIPMILLGSFGQTRATAKVSGIVDSQPPSSSESPSKLFMSLKVTYGDRRVAGSNTYSAFALSTSRQSSRSFMATHIYMSQNGNDDDIDALRIIASYPSNLGRGHETGFKKECRNLIEGTQAMYRIIIGLYQRAVAHYSLSIATNYYSTTHNYYQHILHGMYARKKKDVKGAKTTKRKQE